MKEVFKCVVPVPFVVVSVKEKIRRKFPYPIPEALPGVPNELGVIEDVVSGGGLDSHEASVFIDPGIPETLHVCVTKSN